METVGEAWQGVLAALPLTGPLLGQESGLPLPKHLLQALDHVRCLANDTPKIYL